MGEQTRKQQHSTLFDALYRHRVFVLVLACYLIACIYSAFRIAPLAGPDEAAHYAYVTYIRNIGDAPPKFQQDEGRTKRLEPPAYYTLVAIASAFADYDRTPEFEPNPFYASTQRGNQNPVLRTSPILVAARLATVVFGLLGAIGLYVALVQWLGVTPAVILVALLVFQPNYIAFSATLNNDVAVVCVGLWTLAAVIGIVQRGGSQLKHFGLGALWGVAMLMHANGLVFGIALPIVWFCDYRRNGFKPAMRCAIDSLAGFGVFYGPWFLNRLLLAGPFDTALSASFTDNQNFYAGIALVIIAITVAWLLVRKPREDKPGLSSRLTLLFVVALAAFTLYGLVTHLQDTQPRANTLTFAQIPSTPTKTALQFGKDQSIELLTFEPQSATQGQRADVPLYWRALKPVQGNYAIHAQLLVPNGPQTAQLDEQISFPSYGTSLTQDWREGDVIADTLSLYPTTTVALNGPTRAVIVIALLQLPMPPTQTLSTTLPVWRDGVAVDFSAVHHITVRPAQPLSLPAQFALPAPAQFGEAIGDQIALAAFATNWADGKLHLRLWWQALADGQADLTLFTHVLGADGKLLAQSDGVPNAGLSPTQFWHKGDVIRDERTIEIAQQSGLSLALGFYDSVSKERVLASQAGKPLQDNVLRLSVTPDP